MKAVAKSTNTTFYIGKINKDTKVNQKFINNKITNFDLINKKEEFKNSKIFKDICKKEVRMHQHPFLYKKIEETNNNVTLKVVNLTHSQKDIIINNNIIKTIKVSSYFKEGKDNMRLMHRVL